MKKVMTVLAILLFFVFVSSGGADTTDLTFTPDAGIRKTNASNPFVGTDNAGTYYLLYEDQSSTSNSQNSNRSLNERLATSSDGLDFGEGVLPSDYANDPRRVLLPNGQWRLYEYNIEVGGLESLSSTDGVNFTQDTDVRYVPVEADNGTFGVYYVFVAPDESVILLYIGDMYGKNNVRLARSTDNGWTFTFVKGNVFGDDDAGGGGNTYVDQKGVALPDGRHRILP